MNLLVRGADGEQDVILNVTKIEAVSGPIGSAASKATVFHEVGGVPHVEPIDLNSMRVELLPRGI